jgi:hypothetical protein
MVMLFRSPPAFSAPDPSILFAPLQYHQPLKMCRCKVSFQSGMELKNRRRLSPPAIVAPHCFLATKFRVIFG